MGGGMSPMWQSPQNKNLSPFPSSCYKVGAIVFCPYLEPQLWFYPHVLCCCVFTSTSWKWNIRLPLLSRSLVQSRISEIKYIKKPFIIWRKDPNTPYLLSHPLAPEPDSSLQILSNPSPRARQESRRLWARRDARRSCEAHGRVTVRGGAQTSVQGVQAGGRAPRGQASPGARAGRVAKRVADLSLGRRKLPGAS